MTWRANQRTLVVISIVLMALSSPSAAKTIYVDANAPGPTHDGSSWTNAYQYLQDGLTDAVSVAEPSEIQVAEGIYKPDRSMSDPNGSGDRTATFQLINGVILKGDYAGYGQPDPNARDIELYESILSGDLAGNDADVNEARELFDDPCRAENSYHVVYSYQNDANAVLDGFAIHSGSGSPGGGIYNYCSSPTIANCTFSRNTGSHGGGMYNVFYCSTGGPPPPDYLGKPVLSNCTFIMNAAEGSGGGMFNGCYAEPTVTNCAFIDNWAYGFGGGICNAVNDSKITICTFIGNSTSEYGGGIHNGTSNSIITNCTFSGNSTYNYGGGMSNRLSNPIVTGCTFRKNLAQYGGGMYNWEDSSPILTNCLFVENRADGAGMFSWDSNPRLMNCTFSCNWCMGDYVISGFNSFYSLTNCIVWGDLLGTELGGPAVVTYSNIQGGWPGEGNIDTNPCFVQPGIWADPCNTPGDYIDDIWIDGDYHLRSQAGRWEPNSESWVQDNITSPCIDAGNPGCPLGAEPEFNGNRRNMGAYGGTAEASKSPPYWRSIADTTNDWIVDSNDLKVFADYWLQTGECIPGDFDRSRFVDFNDFAIFGGYWRQKGPGPGITYEVGQCIPTEPALSVAEEPGETRFTVTVEGSNINFQDLITANCCADEIELQMTVETGLITIYEIEHTPMPPCPCIFDYPITAKLGPFEPDTYILEVYQDGYFIGTTIVTIAPPG